MQTVLIVRVRSASSVALMASQGHRLAELRTVIPARVDPDGTWWWSIREMRDEISNYRGDNDKD